MIVRALDSNGDWTFGRGTSDYLTQMLAIEQCISTRLYSFLGDCFFNVNAGINWFNFLGSKNQVGLNTAVSTVIINTYGVTDLIQLSIVTDPSTRRCTITYEVSTIFSGSPNNARTLVDSIDLLTTEDGNVLTTEQGQQISS